MENSFPLDSGYRGTVEMDRHLPGEIVIRIERRHCSVRSFRVLVTKDGLRIRSGGGLSVVPRASNEIDVDYIA